MTRRLGWALAAAAAIGVAAFARDQQRSHDLGHQLLEAHLRSVDQRVLHLEGHDRCFRVRGA